MPNVRLKILVCLILFSIMAAATSIRAVDYNVGVSVGQYVKYGNYVSFGYGSSDQLNKTDWGKIEVTAVSGKNVTLHMTGKYKNGTDFRGSGEKDNVETGWMNTTSGSTTVGLTTVIAGNLQQGDFLPGSTFRINKTETRTYAGASWTVNVFNLTVSSGGMSSKTVWIWDKVSGMLLEMQMAVDSSILVALKSRMSFSAIESNIQASGGGSQDYTIYIVAAAVLIMVAVAIVAFRLRKKPSPPEETAPTSETAEPAEEK